MKNLPYVICLSILMLAGFHPPVLAVEEAEQIPARITGEHWACRDVAELGRKYEADKKLPDSVMVEGKPCSKTEVASCLLSVIRKIKEKCDREGTDAVPREDLDRIAKLRDALKKELEGMEVYRPLQESVEKMLAKPEAPPFLLKSGIKGFLRGDVAGNQRLPDFSYNPGHSEGRFLYRVLPYAYWHPTDFIDVHMEGQGYGYTGGNQYLGKVSLYQGFVEGKIPDSDLLALKVGRQELVYGSSFILGADTFYKGLTYDAARLRVKPASALTIDLLGGWYSHPWSNGVTGYLTGGYATYAFREGTALDAYGLVDTGSTEHHRGEYTAIWGLRGTAKIGAVSLEFEPVFESGRTFNSTTGNNDSINAWGGHADATFETELWNRKNTIFASYAYGSGSQDTANNVNSNRREFRQPATDTPLTGDMSLIGDLSGITLTDASGADHRASGLQVFNVGWGMEITRELNFSATGRYFYANAVPAGFSRNIGLETDFTLTYTLNENLTLIAGYDHFFAGRFFRDATGSGRDVDYGYIMLQFDISRSWPRLKLAKGR